MSRRKRYNSPVQNFNGYLMYGIFGCLVYGFVTKNAEMIVYALGCFVILMIVGPILYYLSGGR